MERDKTDESVLKRLVRIGTVTDVRESDYTARVKFQDCGMTSGWLHVLKNHPFIPDANQQQTEMSDGHRHSLVVKPWLPSINDTVVVLYLPVFNADGFILGGI